MKFSWCFGLFAMTLGAVSPVWAQEGPLPPPSQAHKAPAQSLKPGRAAGVSRAQQINSGIALVAGGGIVAIIALVASSGSGGGDSNPAQVQQQVVPATTAP